jgi:hypothetical protein
MFYSAMCYYELNQNTNALTILNQVSTQRVNTFKEEADWYRSLIYTEEQQFAQAESLLNEIVTHKGYYGAQAQKTLDSFYK